MTLQLKRIATRLPRLLAIVVLPAILTIEGYGQTVSGLVSDADGGFPLAGAAVVILDTGGSQLTGTATGLDGRYSVSIGSAGTFSVRAQFVGFQVSEESISLSSGQNVTLDFVLSQTGFELNTVIVAASRRQEKALDAPASISVLNAREVESNVGTSSVEALRTTTGVDMAQTGVDRREMVLRGFNNAFSGAAYVLTDYRHAAVPSLNLNVYSILPSMNIDTDRIEVVRGPGSALYGAGVDEGVVHFITKDPFTHPGTTVSLAGGEQSLFSAQARHAGVFGVNNNMGYKLTGMYSTADDWALDPTNQLDSIQIALDEGPRRTDYEKFNVNGSFEYRFSDTGSLVVNGGYAEFTAAVLSGIGTVQADGFGYTYGQLRLQVDNFFAQVYMNKNSAGKSFVYGGDLNADGILDDRVVDNGVLYTGQAQYDLSMAEDRQQFIIGADIELTRPDTEGTILGRNEDNDNISEYGGYIQSQTKISQQLEMTLAARGDYNNITDDFTISPRAALVFKPKPNHSFRITWNRAFSSPTSNSNFLDIEAGRIPNTNIIIRGRGSADGFSWQRNPAFESFAGTDLVASSLNPAALGAPGPVGLPLDAVYGAVYGGIAAIPTSTLTAMLQANGIPVPNDATTGALVALLGPDGGTTVSGFSRGVLGKLNLTTTGIDLLQDYDLTNVDPLRPTISQTIEVGYKGLITDRVLVAVDAYYTTKEDFVGPLIMETPFVVVPNLENDLMSAIATGISGNATLMANLGAFGLSAEQVAGLLVTLASDDLPGNNPVAIVQPAENDPGIGRTPELMLTYRNFGNVSFYGVDASIQVMASDQFDLFGNVSFVSDDFFDNKELEEDNEKLILALNAPAFKLALGFNYSLPGGLSFNASGRYVDSFPVLSGPYVGGLPAPFGDPTNPLDRPVEDYFLLDIGAGYDFQQYVPGLRMDLGISNVTDDIHREFIGAPQLGRMAIARMTYHFQ